MPNRRERAIEKYERGALEANRKDMESAMARGEKIPGFISDEEMNAMGGDEKPPGFISDEEMNAMDGREDPYSILRGSSEAIMGGLGKVASTVDSLTLAPVRGVVGNLQAGKSAFDNLSYPTDPESVPTSKKIMGNMGVSEEEFDTPLNPILNPITGERLKLSPAGVLGGIAEGLIDPLTWAGDLPIKAGGKVMEGVSRVGRGIGDIGAERAIKSVTGHSKRGLMDMGLVNPSDPNINRMLGNIHERGRMLMEKDAAGAPVVGWFSGSKGIADRAADKRKFFGDKIGKIDAKVDELVPEGIWPENVAQDYTDYARSLKPVGEEKKIIPRVLEEAQNMRELGLIDPIDGSEMAGPPRPLSVSDARDLKGKFPYKQISNDPLETNAGARNRMRSVLQGQIDQNAEKALGRAVSEEDAKLLGSAQDTGKRYGLYKDATTIAAKEEGGKQSRRMISPSSMGLGIGGAAGLIASGQAHLVPLAVASAVGNQIMLNRGPAFGARLANAISKRMLNLSGGYNKYVMPFQRAAKAGNAAVIGLHHQLMQSDPEYQNLMAPSSEEQMAP